MDPETTRERGQRTADWRDWKDWRDKEESKILFRAWLEGYGRRCNGPSGFLFSWHCLFSGPPFTSSGGVSACSERVVVVVVGISSRSSRWKKPGMVQGEQGLHMRQRPDLPPSSLAHTYPEPASHRCASPRLPGPRDPASLALQCAGLAGSAQRQGKRLGDRRHQNVEQLRSGPTARLEISHVPHDPVFGRHRSPSPITAIPTLPDLLNNWQSQYHGN